MRGFMGQTGVKSLSLPGLKNVLVIIERNFEKFLILARRRAYFY